MNVADRVRRLLHNPGQTAVGYSIAVVPADPKCARCQNNPRAVLSDWCPGCRAWMRGETDDDPKPPDDTIDWAGVTGF